MIFPFITVLVYFALRSQSPMSQAMLLNSSIHTHDIFYHLRYRRSPLYPTKQPLHCPPCSQLHCYKGKRQLHCKGGYTVGVCGCCRTCAKVEGELCGGDHNFLGRCDKGLACEPMKPREFTYKMDGVTMVYAVRTGTCKKDSQKKSSHRCKPKCNPDFCNKNPRALCSANENAEIPKKCQGSCQHTSCRACRFVQVEKPCPTCVANDFKCIRDFGRCYRKKMCKSKAYPCGNLKAVKFLGAEFSCIVPECPV